MDTGCKKRKIRRAPNIVSEKPATSWEPAVLVHATTLQRGQIHQCTHVAESIRHCSVHLYTARSDFEIFVPSAQVNTLTMQSTHWSRAVTHMERRLHTGKLDTGQLQK